MLLSANKAKHCYTEGVVLASRIEALFRAVPPSLYLALGMTEKEEKAQRRALMNEYGISELGGAKRVAGRWMNCGGSFARGGSRETLSSGVGRRNGGFNGTLTLFVASARGILWFHHWLSRLITSSADGIRVFLLRSCRLMRYR